MEHQSMNENDPSTADNDGTESVPGFQRPGPGKLIARALQLKCPKCGDGKLYTGWSRMADKCTHCGLNYHPAPGYYLGATYVNYGITAMTTTIVFLTMRLGFNVPTGNVVWPLMGFCILFPLLIHRFARALWLAFDCHFDSSMMDGTNS